MIGLPGIPFGLPAPFGLPTPLGLVRQIAALVPGPAGEPRVVVVTGASSGIGEATALRMATRGHHLVLVARREATLEDVASCCRAEGASSVLVVPTDVADDQQCAQLVGRVLDEHGRIDAVLHCAGVVVYGRVEELPAEEFDRVVRINLLGTANIARHVIPVLREQEAGDLVIVGSLLGQIAVPSMTPYVVSKWGVRALARQLAIENGDLAGIHISHVAPGSVDTPIYGTDEADDDGRVRTPPPPVISAERVARVVEQQLGHSNLAAQTALSNYGILLAFNLAPRVWDKVIGPVYELTAKRKP